MRISPTTILLIILIVLVITHKKIIISHAKAKYDWLDFCDSPVKEEMDGVNYWKDPNFNKQQPFWGKYPPTINKLSDRYARGTGASPHYSPNIIPPTQPRKTQQPRQQTPSTPAEPVQPVPSEPVMPQIPTNPFAGGSILRRRPFYRRATKQRSFG